MSTLTLPARPAADRLWPRALETLFLADPRKALAACAMFFVAVVFIDFVTPVQLNLTFAYISILIFVGWHGGPVWGLVFAMLAFLVQVIGFSVATEPFVEGIFARITLANRLFCFLVVVALVAAVRNLFDMLQRYAARLQAMSRHLVHLQEVERRRLSRELHDCAGQHLMAVGINLDVLDNDLKGDERARARLSDARAYVGEVCDWIRSALEELRPTVLDSLGLVPALQQFTRNLPRYMGISAALRVQGDPRPLGHDVELALFRVVQESLANASRHSGAAQAVVHIDYRPQSVSVMVADGGRGFDPSNDRRAQPRGFGLLIMQERAAAIGASFGIDSSPGYGTRVSVELRR